MLINTNGTFAWGKLFPSEYFAAKNIAFSPDDTRLVVSFFFITDVRYMAFGVISSSSGEVSLMAKINFPNTRNHRETNRIFINANNMAYIAYYAEGGSICEIGLLKFDIT